MSDHTVSLEWQLQPHANAAGTYSRDHAARYEPGPVVEVSAGTDYFGNAACADPEQLLVNALASCHMLYFLALCEGSGFTVSRYADRAVGRVEKKASGGFWIASITLSPKVEFSGEKVPTDALIARLHDRAHKGCFIANSLATEMHLDLDSGPTSP